MNVLESEGGVPSVVKDTFAIADPAAQLERVRVETDLAGYRHETFEQRHSGVPVFSGTLKVHYDKNGKFTVANGRFYPVSTSVDVNPSISSEHAAEIAKALAGGSEARVFSSSLTIVDPGWYGDPIIGAHLAFHVVVWNPTTGHELAAFVDAKSGALLDAWDLRCSIIDREIYNGTGQSDIPGFLARIEGQPLVGDYDVDSLYDYVGDTYDYFFYGFNRDGITGNGDSIRATARVDDIGITACPNASWSFVFQQLFFCSGTTADDIVAHEWVHGLTQNTANLIYQHQPGQLNESFSDVFGELVDLYNSDSAFAGTTTFISPWTNHPTGPGLDDFFNFPRTVDSCSSSPFFGDGLRWIIAEDSGSFEFPLRDMWRPSCFNHPPTATDPLQTCNLADGGGLHSGSGIVNHAFAMLCDGKTFNGQTVTGIGPIKAGAIWYRALTTYLTVGSDFTDAYLAFIQSANDLIGIDPLDPRTGAPSGNPITAIDAQQVVIALDAVELNAPDVCGETRPMLSNVVAPTCEDKTVLFDDDFESGVGAWTVSNSGSFTPYDWTIINSLPFSRPGSAWFVEDRNVGDCDQINESGVHDLVSPLISIPANVETLTLEFTHFAEVEPRYDGGIVEISVNAGPWVQIPSVAFRNNGYNTSFFNAQNQDNTNPLAGRVSFSGVGGGWGVSTAELIDLVAPGDSMRLRFRFGKDNCFGFTGWYVDDVKVFACAVGDCNDNGVSDEIDRATGPKRRPLLIHELNRRAAANFSDLDPTTEGGPVEIAEDFELFRSSTVTSIRVWGGYENDVPVAADDFTVRFYENDEGFPGAVIAEESGVPTFRTATGGTFFLNDEYQYDLTLMSPVSLAPGTYLISVANNTFGSTDTWLWARAWFGWIPGVVFIAPACGPGCKVQPFNMAIEIYGEVEGRGLGDLNADTVVDLSDVPLFVNAIVSGTGDNDQRCAADMNQDGLLDGRDVAGFADCLTGGSCGP